MHDIIGWFKCMDIEPWFCNQFWNDEDCRTLIFCNSRRYQVVNCLKRTPHRNRMLMIASHLVFMIYFEYVFLASLIEEQRSKLTVRT
jgi:hypothetical protein